MLRASQSLRLSSVATRAVVRNAAHRTPFAARLQPVRLFSDKPAAGATKAAAEAGKSVPGASEVAKQGGSGGAAFLAWLFLGLGLGGLYVGREMQTHPTGPVVNKLRSWGVPVERVPVLGQKVIDANNAAAAKAEEVHEAAPEPQQQQTQQSAAPELEADPEPEPEPEPEPKPEPVAAPEPEPEPEVSPVVAHAAEPVEEEEEEEDAAAEDSPADAAAAKSDDSAAEASSSPAEDAAAIEAVETNLSVLLSQANKEHDAKAEALAAEQAASLAAAEQRRIAREKSEQHLQELQTQIDSQVAESIRHARSMTEGEIVRLLQEDLVSSIARDVDRLSEDDLRERVLKLTTELRDRGKWEALRLNEVMKRQDELWAKRMQEVLQGQVDNFESHLATVRSHDHNRMAALLAEEQAKRNKAYDAQVMKEVERITARRVAALQEQINAKYAKAEDKRIAALKELKAQTAVAMEALRNRFAYERLSHRVHKVNVAITAMRDSLLRDGRAVESVEALRAVAGDDEVIKAALDSLPEGLATRGVPTLRNLQQRFDTVYTAAHRAALANKGNMLGHAVGLVTSVLVVKKNDDSVAEVDDPTHWLTRAQTAVAAGDLPEALSSLSHLKGMAQDTVSDWRIAAEERVAVDQAVQMMSAQAATLSASLY